MWSQARSAVDGWWAAPGSEPSRARWGAAHHPPTTSQAGPGPTCPQPLRRFWWRSRKASPTGSAGTQGSDPEHGALPRKRRPGQDSDLLPHRGVGAVGSVGSREAAVQAAVGKPQACPRGLWAGRGRRRARGIRPRPVHRPRQARHCPQPAFHDKRPIQDPARVPWLKSAWPSVGATPRDARNLRSAGLGVRAGGGP